MSGDDTTSRNTSQPDSDIRFDMAAAFLQRLTGDHALPVTFQTFDDATTKDPAKARILHGKLGDHFDSLTDLNDNGAGVFVAINETDLAGRRAENIKRIRAVHIDDDNGIATPSSLPLPPQIIVETSPGKKQVYLLTDCENFEQYDGVIERMVKDHGCDPGAKGRNRVFRLPGFYHKKNPAAPHLVSISHMTDDPPYAWAEILKAFPPCNNGSKEKKATFDDPIYLHLQAKGWVLDAKPDGRVHITCPFKDSHTTGDAVSSTTYFIAHTNGFKNGHFKCQHGHCAERSDAAFLFAVGYTGAGGEAGPAPFTVPSRQDLEISFDEWVTSPLAPTCIVEHYLYADVAALVAPGGTGKTTQQVYEAIHIVLQKDLYGNKVITPGWVLFVTSEDGREILIARLREVSRGMGLTPAETDVVRRKIAFWDVSERMLKLIHLDNNNVVVAPVAREIVAAHQDAPPVEVIFDPAVSFGIGEDRVNTNEQGLIMAARVIRNGLGCAVRIVHHTGKAVAREKINDQYAGRGGSALADGARMVAVMHPWKPDGKTIPPDGCVLSEGSSITILYRPKLSYAPPNLPAIWIRRVGWKFQWFEERIILDEDRDRAIMDKVEQYIQLCESRRDFVNATNLVNDRLEALGLTRKQIKKAVEDLVAMGRVFEKELPRELQVTKRKTYLATRQDSAGFEKDTPEDTSSETEKNQKNNAAAYRENPGGINFRPDLPPSLNNAELSRQDSAGLAGLDDKDTEEITWDTIL